MNEWMGGWMGPSRMAGVLLITKIRDSRGMLGQMKHDRLMGCDVTVGLLQIDIPPSERSSERATLERNYREKACLGFT